MWGSVRCKSALFIAGSRLLTVQSWPRHLVVPPPPPPPLNETLLSVDGGACVVEGVVIVQCM